MDKIYIGGMKSNTFHKAEGQVDLTLFLTGEDIAKITNHAKAKGPGTFTNKDGKTVVKVRIQTAKAGDKFYAEIDQYVPKEKPEGQPSKQPYVLQDDDQDLPF